MTHIDLLPNEIISLIAIHLHQRDLYTCSFVNQQFFTATNPLLWRTPFLLKPTAPRIVLACIASTSQHHFIGQHIRKIDFFGFPWADSDFLLLMKYVGGLEELIMGKTNRITAASLQQLPLYCPHLKYLQVGIMRITQVFLTTLGQHCRRLGHLHLAMADTESNRGFFSALVAYPLKKLCLSDFKPFHNETRWMNNINDDDDDDDDDRRTTALAMKPTIVDLTVLHGLMYLTIDAYGGGGGEFGGYYSRFDCTRCTVTLHYDSPEQQLTHFCLDSLCPTLNHTLAMTILHSHQYLKVLQLYQADINKDNNNNITDITLDAMIGLLPEIELLGLTYNRRITHHGIRRLIRHCKQLMRMDIQGCGIKSGDFPEAGPDCVDDNDSDYLYCLDTDAMNKIRLEL